MTSENELNVYINFVDGVLFFRIFLASRRIFSVDIMSSQFPVFRIRYRLHNPLLKNKWDIKIPKDPLFKMLYAKPTKSLFLPLNKRPNKKGPCTFFGRGLKFLPLKASFLMKSHKVRPLRRPILTKKFQLFCNLTFR